MTRPAATDRNRFRVLLLRWGFRYAPTYHSTLAHALKTIDRAGWGKPGDVAGAPFSAELSARAIPPQEGYELIAKISPSGIVPVSAEERPSVKAAVGTQRRIAASISAAHRIELELTAIQLGGREVAP